MSRSSHRAARWLPFVLALLVAPPAGARVVQPAGHPPSPRKATFWEKVKSPHADEIAGLLTQATFLRFNLANQYYDPHTQPARKQVLREALARYEQAAALDPARLDLRLEAAHTALEAGEYERAIAHYLAYRERSSDNALLVGFDLGEAYLRLRRWDDAIAELEPLADEAATLERGRCLTWLGYAYMGKGRLDDAIDALERGVAAYPQQYGGLDYIGLLLLAVAYDRDEQLERAHDVLDQLRAVDPQFYILWQPVYMMANQLPSTRYYLPTSPPADKHYLVGLVLEAQGRWADAAVAWRAYLASHAPAYARRAEQHLALAERSLAQAARERARGGKAGKASKGPPPAPPPPPGGVP